MALIDFNSAVSAYQQAAGAVRSTGGGRSTTSAVASEGDEGFASMISDSLKSAMQSGRQAEELSIKQISGAADLKDVVTAVANAEHTLETLVAVRDKVLSAYQEILRMPI
ncbi:MAG: flagellar hook-basal body complex protein FliE [Alphaproteobacteria bacterium]|nr:flagellar hook-basal body complex protein FliE [Alphaproteobacteria bacterium]PHX99380.1 MAG: flagellar hook-basal body complex protein FliE [Rhodospirillaceae bacterium]